MKIERKTLNDVPGVPCPFCGEGTLAFDSLESFLQAVQAGRGPRCPKCGQAVVMDASRARGCVRKLDEMKDVTARALRMARGAA